jgi:hypothetical protein
MITAARLLLALGLAWVYLCGPEAQAAGEIAFVRQVARQPTAMSEIFLMNPDGSGVIQLTRLTDPADPWTVSNPQWTWDGSKLLFSSNHRMWLSAFYRDIFAVNADGSGLTRLTGWETPGQAPPKSLFLELEAGAKKVDLLRLSSAPGDQPGGPGQGGCPNQGQGDQGCIRAAVSTGKQEGGSLILDDKQVTFAYQGGGRLIRVDSPDVQYDPRQAGFFLTIPNVPAGTRWVKATVNKYYSAVTIAQVPAGGAAEVSLTLFGQGSISCYHPSADPGLTKISYSHTLSGTYYHERENKYRFVDISKQAWWLLDRNEPQVREEEAGFQSSIGRFSPDGQRLALIRGQAALEGLTVLPVGGGVQAQASVLVPGGSIAAQGITYFNTCPAWSHDGRSIAFVNQQVYPGADVRGDIFLVPGDGSGQPVQLTRLGPNQLAWSPTFSPDGQTVLFSVFTAPGPRLSLLQVANGEAGSDIYAVSLAGGPARRLTSDGLSLEPAWRPTPRARPQVQDTSDPARRLRELLKPKASQ